MSVLIKEIEEKKIYEDFVLSYRPNAFLQSWNFGEIYKEQKTNVRHLGVYKENELVGCAQILVLKSKRGIFLFCPYGPMIDFDDKEVVDTFFTHIKELGKKEKAVFIRFAPLMKQGDPHTKVFAEHGCKNAPIFMVSENFWMLDIRNTKSDEELMAQMRKNHRNLIRRAEKDGVTVEMGTSDNLINEFLDIYHFTAKRHGFTAYSDSFIRSQVKNFAKDNQVQVFVAKHEGKTLAASVIMYYGYQASYHHGATIPTKVPASYLMHWKAICEARRLNLDLYNFWGIVDNKPKHPWAGLSLFKKGFGGKHAVLYPTQDIILKKLPYYILNFPIEFIRRKKRHF